MGVLSHTSCAGLAGSIIVGFDVDCCDGWIAFELQFIRSWPCLCVGASLICCYCRHVAFSDVPLFSRYPLGHGMLGRCNEQQKPAQRGKAFVF